MKRTRLLIALLVMLVAASGYAQDSYREAVKQYLKVLDDQYEKNKASLMMMKVLFEKNDQVNIDELNERYFKERLENDLLDFYVPYLQALDLSEADVLEVASLLSTPQGKTYSSHFDEWGKEMITEVMMSLYESFEDVMPGEEINMKPVQPNADIDAAYAAKFKKFMDSFGIVSRMVEAMEKKMNEFEPDIDEEIVKDVEKTKEVNNAAEQKTINWYKENVPVIALNTAYDVITDEDLDYGIMLSSKESYIKLNSNIDTDSEQFKMSTLMVKYMDWMKEQGAKVSEDPEVMMKFLQSIFGQDGESYESEKPWYELDLNDLNPDD